MKNLISVGSVFLALALLLYYLQKDISLESFFSALNFMGILAGIGIGLILGGIIGYQSKGTAIREKQKKEAFRQLQQEKIDLEKQAAELASHSIEESKSSQES